MTIETATPSSVEVLAAMFDVLVDAVAARVLAQLDERIDNKLEHFAEHELDAKIDEWAANFLDDRVKELVTEDDLHDQVLNIVQNLQFEVNVN